MFKKESIIILCILILFFCIYYYNNSNIKELFYSKINPLHLIFLNINTNVSTQLDPKIYTKILSTNNNLYYIGIDNRIYYLNLNLYGIPNNSNFIERYDNSDNKTFTILYKYYSQYNSYYEYVWNVLDINTMASGTKNYVFISNKLELPFKIIYYLNYTFSKYLWQIYNNKAQVYIDNLVDDFTYEDNTKIAYPLNNTKSFLTNSTNDVYLISNFGNITWLLAKDNNIISPFIVQPDLITSNKILMGLTSQDISYICTGKNITLCSCSNKIFYINNSNINQGWINTNIIINKNIHQICCNDYCFYIVFNDGTLGYIIDPFADIPTTTTIPITTPPKTTTTTIPTTTTTIPITTPPKTTTTTIPTTTCECTEAITIPTTTYLPTYPQITYKFPINTKSTILPTLGNQCNPLGTVVDQSTCNNTSRCIYVADYCYPLTDSKFINIDICSVNCTVTQNTNGSYHLSFKSNILSKIIILKKIDFTLKNNVDDSANPFLNATFINLDTTTPNGKNNIYIIDENGNLEFDLKITQTNNDDYDFTSITLTDINNKKLILLDTNQDKNRIINEATTQKNRNKLGKNVYDNTLALQTMNINYDIEDKMNLIITP